MKIRNVYPDLLQHQKRAREDEIQSVFSWASCQLKITRNLEEQALPLHRQNLGTYAGLSHKCRIPLFEYIDRYKITLRMGDKRILRKGPLSKTY